MLVNVGMINFLAVDKPSYQIIHALTASHRAARTFALKVTM